MAYADHSDMIARYDSRRLGQLVKDDGSQATEAELDGDEKLTAILSDASGKVNAAVMRGGRYSAADLAALDGDNLALLKRLVCDLAYGMLVQRRGFSSEEVRSQVPGYRDAEQALTDLADGVRIFATEDAIRAGKPVRVQIGRNKAYVSATLRHYGNLAVDPSDPQQPKIPGD